MKKKYTRSSKPKLPRHEKLQKKKENMFSSRGSYSSSASLSSMSAKKNKSPSATQTKTKSKSQHKKSNRHPKSDNRSSSKLSRLSDEASAFLAESQQQQQQGQHCKPAVQPDHCSPAPVCGTPQHIPRPKPKGKISLGTRLEQINNGTVSGQQNAVATEFVFLNVDNVHIEDGVGAIPGVIASGTITNGIVPIPLFQTSFPFEADNQIQSVKFRISEVVNNTQEIDEVKTSFESSLPSSTAVVTMEPLSLTEKLLYETEVFSGVEQKHHQRQQCPPQTKDLFFSKLLTVNITSTNVNPATNSFTTTFAGLPIPAPSAAALLTGATPASESADITTTTSVTNVTLKAIVRVRVFC
jgi:hypothetical protein